MWLAPVYEKAPRPVSLGTVSVVRTRILLHSTPASYTIYTRMSSLRLIVHDFCSSLLGSHCLRYYLDRASGLDVDVDCFYQVHKTRRTASSFFLPNAVMEPCGDLPWRLAAANSRYLCPLALFDDQGARLLIPARAAHGCL